MNAAALPQTEAQFQAAVLAFAKVNGWRTAHFNQTRREVVRRNGSRAWIGDKDAIGFPDCVFLRERLVLAELKGPKTRVSAEQLAWGQALLDAGEEWYLWRAGAPGVWDEIQRVLGRAS